MTQQPPSQPSQPCSQPPRRSWKRSDVQAVLDHLVLDAEALHDVWVLEDGGPGVDRLRQAVADLSTASATLLSWADTIGLSLRLPSEPPAPDSSPGPGQMTVQEAADEAAYEADDARHGWETNVDL